MLLLCKGDIDSVKMLMEGVNLFTSISGLKPNVQKNNCFPGHVPYEEVQKILNFSGFSHGTLPIRYLGIPLITG